MIQCIAQRKKEENVLFNSTRNTFYIRLYDLKNISERERERERWGVGGEEGRKKPAATTTWGTLQLAARDLLYAPTHRQDSTCHGLCYSSRGAPTGTRNS